MIEKLAMTDFGGGGHPLKALLTGFSLSCILLEIMIKCLMYWVIERAI